jgi:hypothetical protein
MNNEKKNIQVTNFSHYFYITFLNVIYEAIKKKSYFVKTVNKTFFAIVFHCFIVFVKRIYYRRSFFLDNKS